jgi:23S rRNA pseudouridine1911/1915/1917 synthase
MTEPSPAARRFDIATVVVEEADAGERADVVLGRRIPALSRRLARTLARAGKLRVDGRKSPPSTRVAVGARLELELDVGSHDDTAAEQLATLDVLAITERFVYVRKPAGVHMVALAPAQPGVLATAVAAQFPECAEASIDPREGGAVHRLDLPTSGVVAFARSREVWLTARAGFTDELVEKHYLAVSLGGDDAWPPALPANGLRGWIEPAPDSAESVAKLVAKLGLGADERVAWEPIRVRAALGRDGAQRSAVRLDGRRASTVVTPLARSNGYLLSHLLLETGRRHQARVHLAWIGRPIRNDVTYGHEAISGLRLPQRDPHGEAISGLRLPQRDPHGEAISGAERMRSSSIALHAHALDLSAVFVGEQTIFASPPAGFWPPTDP